MTRGDSPGVCFVTDRHLTLGRPLLEVTTSAIAGGCNVVQVREKDLTGGPLLSMARDIVGVAKTRSERCSIVVNDRLDVAIAAKAAGVHLPAAGLPVREARRHAGRRFLIGRSVHSLAEARAAQKEGADYLFFGPVFMTPGKSAFGPPQGPEALGKVVEGVAIPVWAIGGIHPGTAAELRGIRVAGIAAISFIASAEDPAGAIAALRAALSG